MRTLSEIELAKEIEERKEVNFIAFATTPWHALGVNATMHHLKKQHIVLCGYIVIMPHQVTGVGIGKDNFLLEEAEDILQQAEEFDSFSLEAVEHYLKSYGISLSDLEPDFVRSIFLTPMADAQTALNAAFEKLGPDATVLAMPFGGSTLPHVREN